MIPVLPALFGLDTILQLFILQRLINAAIFVWPAMHLINPIAHHVIALVLLSMTSAFVWKDTMSNI